MTIMWPRAGEIVLGAWLAASPWLAPDWFAPGQADSIKAASIVAGLAIASLAVASFMRPFHRAHLASMVLACGVFGWSLFVDVGRAPAIQNLAAVVLLTLLLSVVPCPASRPPASWEEFNATPPAT
jgi:hypothetical protein